MKWKGIDSLNLKYTSPARDFSGYGEASRHDIAALNAAGVNLTCEIPSYVHDLADYGKLGRLASSFENAPLDYKIKILHITPNLYPKYMESGVYHIGRVFWETDKLPVQFSDCVQMMDEIWTGSEYNKQAIINSGVTKPIYIIPQAIDTDIGDVQPYKTVADTTYRFYSIFEWTERKNPKALLKAFWTAFEGISDVSLVLKTYVDSFAPDKKREIKNNIQEVKDSLNLTRYAPVYVYDDLLNREDMYRFHKSCNCFVSAHRGEGWGIPQMEAMLVGNPVISTDCGGIHEHVEYITKIPYKSVPVKANSRNQQWYTNDQKWADISFEELGSAMRNVYYSKFEKVAKKQQKQVIDKFNFKTVGEIMRKRLEEIHDTLH